MKQTLTAIALALSLTLAPPVWAQDTGNRAQILERIETERQKALTELQNAIRAEHELRADAPGGIYRLLGDSDPNLITYRMRMEAQSKKVAEAEAKYRQTLTAEILTATRGLTQKDATDYLYHRELEANATYDQIGTRTRTRLMDQVRNADSDQDRRAAYATADSRLRAAQLEEEIVAAAQRRHKGLDDSSRLRTLLDRAASTKVTLRPSDIADPTLREFETHIRKTRMEQQIAEYRRLARSGRLIDPASNQVITGQRRLELAYDADTALAQELDARTLKPNRYDILAWTLSEPERRTQSKILVQDIKETDEYTALNYMGGAAAGDISDQLRAMGHAVKLQQTGVNDWRAGFTKNHAPTGIGAIDETVNVIRTGSADFARQANAAGVMSIDRVDARIAKYHQQADALVAALNTAASQNQKARAAGQVFDPKSLPPAQYKLLKDGKFIAATASGREVLQLPHDGPSLSRLKSGLNLPGDHLLNMVSAEKMMEMAALSYVPGAAAGRVGKLMEGLKLGSTATRGGMIAADVITGMALDAGVEYARTGKVDAGRLAIESTFLQGATTGLGRGTGALTKRMASVFKNPRTRKAMEVTLAQGLGLSSEAALQTYFQSAMEGKDMSYEDFLANMVNGVMGRGTSGAIHKKMFKVMPEDLARDMSARQEVLFRNKQKASSRLKKVLGKDLVDAGLTQESLRLNRLSRAEKITQRMDEALKNGDISWSELKMLYADNPGLYPMMKGLAEHRARTFQSYVEPAQALARQELEADYAEKRAAIEAKHPPRSVFRQRALDRLGREYTAELKAINTNPRAPGSGNVTSDIDRSIMSDRVRRQLKKLYRLGEDGGGPDATSARSYDVNEYIDVFPTINKTMPRSAELAKLPVETGDFKGLTHEQAIEAGSMATAMLHMNDAQRGQYRENTLAGAGDTALTTRQLDMAEASLRKADKDLQAEMDRIAAENPRLARNKSDLALRARDNLYGKRTEALRKKGQELMHIEREIDRLDDMGLTEDAPQIQELRGQERKLLAEMQRDWGLSLREGIETYASFSGLDAIVNDGQIQKRSIRDLINDPGYRIAKDGETPGKGNSLKAFSPKQLDGFMRDQVMMMTHHMNGHREGHEGAVDAGSAMGKYAERAVLALKLQGQDLSKPPFKELNEISEQMVKARKDPAKLKAYMEQVGQKYAGKKDADAGLEVLAGLIEKAIPQTRGLWDAKTMGLSPKRGLDPAQPTARELRRQIASRRHLLRDEEEERLKYGPASAAAMNDSRMATLQQELDGLTQAKAERARLGAQYRPQDWDKARKLEAEAASLEHRIKWMEGLGTKVPDDHPAKKRLAATRAQLAGLQQAYADAGGTGRYVPSEEDARADTRMAAIRQELAQRQEAAKGFEAAQEQVNTARAKAELPDGFTAPAPDLPLEGFDPSQRGSLRVSLAGKTVQIPIVPR